MPGVPPTPLPSPGALWLTMWHRALAASSSARDASCTSFSSGLGYCQRDQVPNYQTLVELRPGKAFVTDNVVQQGTTDE